ncbi:unnamed protein product, partial [Sphacelaria rigidula]
PRNATRSKLTQMQNTTERASPEMTREARDRKGNIKLRPGSVSDLTPPTNAAAAEIVVSTVATTTTGLPNSASDTSQRPNSSLPKKQSTTPAGPALGDKEPGTLTP